MRRGKVRELFLQLALSKGKSVAREKILNSIWPEKDPHHALANYYTAWSRLSRTLSPDTDECPYLQSNRHFSLLNSHLIELDIIEFEQLAKAVTLNLGPVEARMEAAFQLEQVYRGDILQFLHDNPIIEKHRQIYRNMFVDACIAATQLFAAAGSQSNALWFAQKALHVDPSREDACRTLMAMQERAGRRTSAMKAFFDCKKYLSSELGIAPSRQTTAMYQELVLDKR